ncbi:transposase [Vibrio sp. 10N.286.49.B3]|nr:transposase [Vibrio sp. 10N.286.49.B3]
MDNSFGKIKTETILKIPGHVSLNDVQIWFQDEARFGQRNTTTRIWAEKGTRPRAVQQQQFEYDYLFGAICVTTGQAEAIVAPLSNMEVMKEHFKLNPIEQVWSWLRQNEIANRCFTGYNDIVDKLCSAWNRFCEDKNRVVSLCFRDWVNLIK